MLAIPDILYSELKKYKSQNKIVNIKKDFLFKRKDGEQESGYLMEKVFPNIIKETDIEKIGFYPYMTPLFIYCIKYNTKLHKILL